MKRKKRQLSQTSIAYIAAGAVLAGVMTLFGISAFLSVNSIIIEGIVSYSAEQVAEASGVARGDNLLYLNKRNVEKNISTQLTYINSVETTRKMPDTLVITVTESTPLAYMPFAGDALIIDSTGRILDRIKLAVGVPVEAGGVRLIEIRGVPIKDAEIGSLPVVELGAETSFTAMRDILAIMERENIAADVNYLDVANIINISFGYDDMYRVVVGGTRDIRHKISGLRSTVSQFREKNPNARGVINMTNPSGEYSFLPD